MAKGKSLKYPHAMDQCVGAHLTSKGALCRCIDDISSKFAQDPEKPSKRKAKQKKKFEKSCFGKLFKGMHQITFCGGLVHYVLMRQVESTSPTSMEFNFEGSSAVFSLREFGLITGLKVTPPSNVIPPPTSQRIINTYFEGKTKIKTSKLREVFEELNINQVAERDDFVKLCLMYFLEVGILGKESQVNINLDHFSMVEDLDYFNQHPWGQESFDLLIASMRKALDTHGGALNKSLTYSLCGCPLAFQVYMVTKSFNNNFELI